MVDAEDKPVPFFGGGTKRSKPKLRGLLGGSVGALGASKKREPFKGRTVAPLGRLKEPGSSKNMEGFGSAE